MKKPEVGNQVTVHEDALDGCIPEVARVIAVFDSLDESWDPWGESAWAQMDVNAATGKTGEWYVIVQHLDEEGETWSLASYEIAEVR